MWSSENDKHDNKKKNKSVHGSSSRIVSSSSTRSSPSSTSSILPQTPRRRTMEEVWKDITLATLHQETPLAPLLETTHSHPHPQHHHHHHHHLQLHRPHPTASPSFRTMILQDFLSGPCSTVSPATASGEHIPLPPSPPPLPPTALTLKSGLELRYLGGGGGGGGVGGGAADGGSLLVNAHSRSSSNSNESRVNGQANKYDQGGSFMPSYFSDAVISPPSPAGLFSFCSKKRMMPEGPVIDGDRRYKRMIKNRESAARSRARKQAHLFLSSSLFLLLLLPLPSASFLFSFCFLFFLLM